MEIKTIDDICVWKDQVNKSKTEEESNRMENYYSCGGCTGQKRDCGEGAYVSLCRIKEKGEYK